MSYYWKDFTRGQFDIEQGWIGLDYAKLIDPVQAELTLFHEQTHAGICATTEFGQATGTIYKQAQFFSRYSDQDKNKVKMLLQEAQFDVQEGFAVLMQAARMKSKFGKYKAQEWLKDAQFPQPYYDAFEILEFGLYLSSTYRDYFTSKIAHLSMMTNIRRDVVQKDLLSQPKLLEAYLSDPQNNPSARLKQICEALKYGSWMVTKSEKEIADYCGVCWFEPPSKQEIADYLNYLLDLSGEKPYFTPEHIGNAPDASKIFEHTAENMIVANMNLNFVGRAIPAWKIDDFIFDCKNAEALFIIPNEKVAEDQELLSYFPIEPDVAYALIGFQKTGEIYMTYVSEATAEKVLSNELKTPTLITKWDFYDQVQEKYLRSTSTNMRKPDILIHNNVSSVLSVFAELQKQDKNQKFSYLYMGFVEDHPFQTLIAVPDKKPVNIVNAFGNRGIQKIIDQIKPYSTNIDHDGLLAIKKEINNVMSIWMGLYWEIDWVETMVGDKESVIFRK